MNLVKTIMLMGLLLAMALTSAETKAQELGAMFSQVDIPKEPPAPPPPPPPATDPETPS